MLGKAIAKVPVMKAGKQERQNSQLCKIAVSTRNRKRKSGDVQKKQKS
jgi:hypothetical protein